MLEIRFKILLQNDDRNEIISDLYLDQVNNVHRIKSIISEIPSKCGLCYKTHISTMGLAGNHQIILCVKYKDINSHISKNIEILHSENPSIPFIGGAWAGLYHWSEKEGKLWNQELKKFNDEDWKQMVKGMHEIGMNTIVIQEVFRNQQYHGRHNIPKEGYQGAAFYPSDLYSQRMDISSNDPIEAILSEADKYNMNVFLGIGLYAWFDFTSSALEWHKNVMDELWRKYGKHSSLYGWYVSAEVGGAIQPSILNKWYYSSKKKHYLIKQYQEEFITFFRELRHHANKITPELPIMLASNCHGLPGTENLYRELMKFLDIICPFGFHRMPKNDLSGEEAAKFLQQICNNQKAHLWLDLEVFLFSALGELYPRPISGLIEDLMRFSNFEKILCYQVPGLMNPPWVNNKPGGPATEKLYIDYMEYYHKQINQKKEVITDTNP